jgi:hypothetical protein
MRRMVSDTNIARLRELTHHGCLQIDTLEIKAPPDESRTVAIRTIIYLDGDMITWATSTDLAVTNQHWATVECALDDLMPLSVLINSFGPVIIIGSLLWCGSGAVSAESLIQDFWDLVLARDFLLTFVLPTGVLWLMEKVGTHWLKRQVGTL